MTDVFLATLGLFASVAVLGSVRAFAALAPIDSFQRPMLALVVMALIFALIAASALISDSILRWLEISHENFQLAAGLVMLPLAFRLLWSGESVTSVQNEPVLSFGRAFLLLASPVPIVVALSYSGRFGTDATLVAAVAALTLSSIFLSLSSGLLRYLGQRGLSQLARTNGALLLVLSVELIVDGIQSV